MAYNNYIAPQPHTTAAAALLCQGITDRTGVQQKPKPAPTDSDLQLNSYISALVCGFVVSITIIHVITWTNTHTDPEGTEG